MTLRSTTLATWAGAIAGALEEQGLDSRAVFTQAGLDIDQTQNPDARFLVSDMTTLWHHCVKATGNPAFGLTVPAFRSTTTFHAMSMAVDACSTLHESLKRLTKLSRLVSNIAELQLEQQASGEWVLTWYLAKEDRDIVAHEAMDAFLSSFATRLAPEDMTQVMMIRPRPADTAPWSEAFHHCPIEFDAEYDAITITDKAMHKVRQSPNPAMVTAGETVAFEYLQRLEKEDIVLQVEAEIRQRLEAGEPKQQDIADALHLSVRQLQRKLANQETSFAQLLQQIRHSLAKEYLADSQRSIVDISLSLGFSDQSNFSAAFRRWEGVSPTEFRQ